MSKAGGDSQRIVGTIPCWCLDYPGVFALHVGFTARAGTLSKAGGDSQRIVGSQHLLWVQSCTIPGPCC